ncbi:MAG: DUF4139 domain-containing protein [Flavobacteriales bacterium]
MKKIISLSLLSVLVANTACAQEEYSKATSSIKSITLFLSGAQVKRTSTFNVISGTNKIKIAGLPHAIDARSIKIEGQPGITLVSVNHRTNYLEEAPQNPYYKKLVAERDAVNLEVQRHGNDQAILNEELNMLAYNQDIKGENETLNAEELMDYSEMYQDRLTDISIKKLEIDRKIKEAQKKLLALNKQISELEYKHNRSTSEILLNISASAGKRITLEFTYSTYSARWIPFYDIRSDETGADVNIELKAKVSQWTGEDWKDVSLVLSTGNPSESHELPKLNSWNLSVQNRSTYDRKKKSKSQKAYGSYNDGYDSNAPAQLESVEIQETEDKAFDYAGNSGQNANIEYLTTTTSVVSTERKEISAEYKINIPYSVPSDSKLYDVDISSVTNAAVYSYYAAPKIAKGAYLLARLPEWQKLNLLDGEANVYFKKTFIGKTRLASELFSDTLDVSLGKDPNVVVDRTRIKAEGAVQVSGTTRTDTYIYEISVKNNKSTAIDMELEDVIPIAQDKEITVKMVDDGDAKFDPSKGKLTWNVKLAAGESKKVRFSYSVKYPRTRKVYGY